MLILELLLVSHLVVQRFKR